MFGNCCQYLYTPKMPTKNVNLSPQQAKFIRSSVHKGRFRNASEVVRAGLRLLEAREREDQLKLKRLRELARQAFEEVDRGEYIEIQPGELDKFMAEMDARVRAKRR
jgi:antitoxin ParD1/3/4